MGETGFMDILRFLVPNAEPSASDPANDHSTLALLVESGEAGNAEGVTSSTCMSAPGKFPTSKETAGLFFRPCFDFGFGDGLGSAGTTSLTPAETNALMALLLRKDVRKASGSEPRRFLLLPPLF